MEARRGERRAGDAVVAAKVLASQARDARAPPRQPEDPEVEADRHDLVRNRQAAVAPGRRQGC